MFHKFWRWVTQSRRVPKGENAVLLLKDWPSDTAELGRARSFFGGDPLLPPDLAWPMTSFRNDNTPMHFLAQISLSDVPEFADRRALPADGTLYFFALAHEEMGCDEGNDPITWATYFVPGPTPTRARSAPEATSDIFHRGGRSETELSPAERRLFRKCSIGFAPVATIPDPLSAPYGALSGDALGHAMDHYRKFMSNNLEVAFAAPRLTDLSADPLWPETAFQAQAIVQKVREQAKNRAAWRANVDLIESGLIPENHYYAGRTEDELKKIAQDLQNALARPWPSLEEVDRLAQELAHMQPIDAPSPEQKSRTRAFAAFTDHLTVRVRKDMAPRVCCEAGGTARDLLERYPEAAGLLSKGTLAHALRYVREAGYNNNRLLGHPKEQQSNSADSALKRLKALGLAPWFSAPKHMRLLAQFDTSYTGTDYMFADCGKAYFFIHQRDLALLRFDRTILVVDGG